jgi:hypothetical protein
LLLVIAAFAVAPLAATAAPDHASGGRDKADAGQAKGNGGGNGNAGAKAGGNGNAGNGNGAKGNGNGNGGGGNRGAEPESQPAAPAASSETAEAAKDAPKSGGQGSGGGQPSGGGQGNGGSGNASPGGGAGNGGNGNAGGGSGRGGEPAARPQAVAPAQPQAAPSQATAPSPSAPPPASAPAFGAPPAGPPSVAPPAAATPGGGPTGSVAPSAVRDTNVIRRATVGALPLLPLEQLAGGTASGPADASSAVPGADRPRVDAARDEGVAGRTETRRTGGEDPDLPFTGLSLLTLVLAGALAAAAGGRLHRMAGYASPTAPTIDLAALREDYRAEKRPGPAESAARTSHTGAYVGGALLVVAAVALARRPAPGRA